MGSLGVYNTITHVNQTLIIMKIVREGVDQVNVIIKEVMTLRALGILFMK